MDDSRVQLIDKIREVAKQAEDVDRLLKDSIELIDNFSDGYDWTGYYLMKGDILEVGPYVGEETPHTKIELNQGICGAAASQKQTVIVSDVNADPRFLACSITTKSEIVVPLMDGDICLGEIDIDSNQPNFFREDDRIMLEEIAELIVRSLKDLSS